MAIVVLAAMTGCPSGKPEPTPTPEQKPETPKDLVVVLQEDSITGIHETNNTYAARFTVDAPTAGPQALVESVMGLLNDELYNYCEFCAHFDEEVTSFTKDEVCTKDGSQLLANYMAKYKPLIQDSVWNVFDRTYAMEAQTESFVTYGVEHFHCGASCGSEKYYYTFDKKDGHRVGEIITHENLVRFFAENPKFATIEKLYEDYDWTFDPEAEFDNTKYGLLADRFMLVVEGVGNHYFTTELPYDLITPYLTPEAQALVKK